jgi:hypothetical protein
MHSRHDVANTRSNTLNTKYGHNEGDTQEMHASKPDFTTSFNMRKPTPASYEQKVNARIHQPKALKVQILDHRSTRKINSFPAPLDATDSIKVRFSPNSCI